MDRYLTLKSEPKLVHWDLFLDYQGVQFTL